MFRTYLRLTILVFLWPIPLAFLAMWLVFAL